MVARAALALVAVSLALGTVPAAAAVTAAALRILARHSAAASAALPSDRILPRTQAGSRARRPAAVSARAGSRDIARPGWRGPEHGSVAVRPTLYVDAVAPRPRSAFGIRLGTWMPALLRTRISSADPGFVELVVSRTVRGRYRPLPAGTLLFCRKRLDRAARRMEMMAVKGITPDGREFVLRGRVFDGARIPGLPGVVVRSTGRMLRRSAAHGVLAAGSAAAAGLLGAGGATAAGEAAAGDSLLGDAGQVIAPAVRNRFTIYVAAQPVLVRVGVTF